MLRPGTVAWQSRWVDGCKVNHRQRRRRKKTRKAWASASTLLPRRASLQEQYTTACGNCCLDEAYGSLPAWSPGGGSSSDAQLQNIYSHKFEYSAPVLKRVIHLDNRHRQDEQGVTLCTTATPDRLHHLMLQVQHHRPTQLAESDRQLPSSPWGLSSFTALRQGGLGACSACLLVCDSTCGDQSLDSDSVRRCTGAGRFRRRSLCLESSHGAPGLPIDSGGSLNASWALQASTTGIAAFKFWFTQRSAAASQRAAVPRRATAWPRSLESLSVPPDIQRCASS